MTVNTTESTAPPTKLPHREPLKDPAAINLLRSGQKLLDAVDSSDFCSSAAFHTQVSRTYPLFDTREIKLGTVLGHGGFGIVFEVKEIVLKKASNEASIESSQDDAAKPTDHDDPDHDELLDHVEYSDATKARAFMAANVQRKQITRLPNGKEIEGAARYAVKRLRSDLNDMHRARGAIDLAIEAKFLSRLSHPNIVKMRGYASGPFLRPDFFIVLDRLYEILNHRLHEWKMDLLHHGIGIYSNFWQIVCCPHRRYRPKNELERKEADRIVHEILLERLVIAYDLASAFSYMHKNRLVYRDIKQENIGFDVRGDVKVFDFGLCKGLSSSLKAYNKVTGAKAYGYNLTPLTGSLPYMAPEVFAGQPYDGQCDVFSFAILLWEMFTLRPAFKHINHIEYEARILRQGERLRLRGLPALIQDVIQESWRRKPTSRPSMERVASMIRGELNMVSDGDDAMLRRTIHMKDRSKHSMRGLSFLLNEERPRSHHSESLRRASSSSKSLVHFNGPSMHNGLEA